VTTPRAPVFFDQSLLFALLPLAIAEFQDRGQHHPRFREIADPPDPRLQAGSA